MILVRRITALSYHLHKLSFFKRYGSMSVLVKMSVMIDGAEALLGKASKRYVLRFKQRRFFDREAQIKFNFTINCEYLVVI